MPAVASSSRQRSPSRPGWSIIVKGPATRAYGFILNQECIHYWAPIFYEEIHHTPMPKPTAKNFKSKLRASCSMVTLMLPLKMYKEFPSIPRLWRRLILFPSGEGYLFVLKDNRTMDTTNTELDPQDVEGIKKRLRLGEQSPKWYDIPT
ncbi:hypothetical protein EVG20_g1423 [Dentipellis fragilis]|uniref:Uncharacterized protein n=1 Tax=Dentipellis fragilis TaxID=205917 RepID=A0A4Y9ZAW6_9AGAM|nr:hypothetical protein EVG20_g1423 [Dentipellis fragilis]